MLQENVYSDLEWIKETFKHFKDAHGFHIKVNGGYKVEKTRAEIESAIDKQAPYIFFTRYDSANKFDAKDNLIKPLSINWRGDGNKIVSILKEFGFKVTWGGKSNDLILIQSVPETKEVALKWAESMPIVEYMRELYKFGQKDLLVIGYKKELRETHLTYQTEVIKPDGLLSYANERAKRLIAGEIRTCRNALADPQKYLSAYNNLLSGDPKPLKELFNKYAVEVAFTVDDKKVMKRIQNEEGLELYFDSDDFTISLKNK